jgi:poly(ADP-ribose) glycohydrolase ARH3
MLGKFIGCLVGTAIGDAFGESLQKATRVITNREIFDRWTDDTHMMIGVTQSLVFDKGFNEEHMASTFVRNYKQEPWRGYGSGTVQVLKFIDSGISWQKASTLIFGGKGSFGNGAAMRVAPVGLLFNRDMNQLRVVAYGQSGITHSNELAREGAFIQACSVSLAAQADPPKEVDFVDFINKLLRLTRNSDFIEKLKKMKQLQGETSRTKIVKELGNGCEALNSVPAAIFSFLSSSSFEETVHFATSLGGDADTIGAMAGAISGAYYGDKNIPKNLRNKLESVDFIEKLAIELYDVYIERNYHRLSGH